MSLPCRFSYSVSDASLVVDDTSDIWASHLPASRHPGDTERSPATVGHYFKAATDFFCRNDCEVIKHGAHRLCDQTIASGDIGEVHICLVKHGTFYHPAKVMVTLTNGTGFNLALNLAVSPEGRQCIDRECDALEALSQRTDAIPILIGKGLSSPDGIDCAMFAARWFDDYHEFHLSFDGEDLSMVVWDDGRGHYFLSGNDMAELYRKAAFIMTCCYNVDTCEQIQPWHHAAGDFVLRKDDTGLDVRLITIRQYTPMLEDTPDDPEVLVDAALIFLIGLSIRMRLDRIDGIKETAWAGDIAVPAVVQGFYEGLLHSAPQWIEPFKAFVSECGLSDLKERAMMVIGAYHPEAPDLVTIRPHLDDHMILLAKTL